MDLKWWVKDQSQLIGNVCRSGEDNDTNDWFVLAANSDCAASNDEDLTGRT